MAAPDGAQRLVDICKGTGAVINGDGSSVSKNNKAFDSFNAAMDDLNDMGVHVNNTGDFPVFTLGTVETAYGPSALVAGAPFLKLTSEVEMSTMTTLVDLSKYRTFKRCYVLVKHQAKGSSEETPSLLHKLCGKVAAFHTGGQNFCSVHKQSMRAHTGDGMIFLNTSDIAVCSPTFGMTLACPLPIAHIEDHCQEVGATPGMPMSTPFILSSSSKDLELKGISTVRIPGYEVVWLSAVRPMRCGMR